MSVKVEPSLALPLAPWKRPVPPVKVSLPPEPVPKPCSLRGPRSMSYIAIKVSPFAVDNWRQPCARGPVACTVLCRVNNKGPKIEAPAPCASTLRSYPVPPQKLTPAELIVPAYAAVKVALIGMPPSARVRLGLRTAALVAKNRKPTYTGKILFESNLRAMVRSSLRAR
jgi:hypothetical protein